MHEEALADGLMITQAFSYKNGNWLEGPYFNMKVVDINCEPKTGEIYLLGEDGDYFEAKTSKSGFIDKEDPPGPFRKIRPLGTRLVSLGRDNTLWKKSTDNWEMIYGGKDETSVVEMLAISESVVDEAFDEIAEETNILFSIAGASSEDHCMVGTDGTVIVCKGGDWSREDVPTNVNLYDVCKTSEGNYLVCGQGGIVLIGQKDSWNIALSDESLGDLVTIAQFGSHYYIANGNKIFRTNLTDFEIVDFGVNANVPSKIIVTGKQQILSIAGKEVFISSDGFSWKSILA